MQYIWSLSDNCDRLQNFARGMQPYPEDHDQRLQQLYTSVRNIIDEVRNDCTQHTLAMGDWDALNTEHLSEDNEWSRRMLRHRRTFFEDPAFIPKQLDEKQMDLLDYYCRIQQRIEDIFQDREEAAKAAHFGERPAHTAGAPKMLSASKQQCAASRLRSQPPPADDQSRYRNTFAEQQPTIQRGWNTARGGSRSSSQRRPAHTAGVAPAPGLAAHSAASNQDGGGLRKPTIPPAPPSQERLKAVMSNYVGKEPPLFYSGPLQVGADGKPLSRSHADAKQHSSARGVNDADHGNAPHRQTSSGRRTPEQRTTIMADVHVLVAQCALCSGPHWPSECPRYDTIQKRMRRVRELKYCYLCLKGGHWIATCPYNIDGRCVFCDKADHHCSLCSVYLSCRKEYNKRHRDPMSATKTEQATRNVHPGVPFAASPTVHPGAPSLPRSVHQATSSVTWAPTHPGASTVPQRLPSAQISLSCGAADNSKEARSSRHRNTEPILMDCPGTSRPTTKINKSMTSKAAYASGPAEFFLKQKSHRVTDRCSKPDETTQFDRGKNPDGSSAHELRTEDVSPNKPSGLDDDYPDWPFDETTTRFAKKIYKRQEEDTTPLLECLLTTARNAWTGETCQAVVVFDRFRTSSLITKELVNALKLCCGRAQTHDFDSFTGFNTHLELISKDGFKLSMDRLATGPLPAHVRTILVDEKRLAALRRAPTVPEAIYAQPHVLIAQDLLLHVQYRHGPCMHGGLFSVHTRLGVAIGGSLQADFDLSSDASTSSRTCSFVFTDSEADDAEKPSRSRQQPPAPRKKRTRSELRHEVATLLGFRPAHSAGDTAALHLDTAYLPAHSAEGTAVYGHSENLEPSTSTSSTSGPGTFWSRTLGVTPQSLQQQLQRNPLDTKPPLLPTLSTTYVDVEEVSAAHTAAGSPRPVQDTLRSIEAELRRSLPPPPAQGPICAPLYDAGPPPRKTRLRYCLPEFARRILGIYADPEPVSTVTLLYSPESTFIRLLRAEQELQFAQMPFSTTPMPLTIIRPQNLFQQPSTLQLCAVLLQVPEPQFSAVFSVFLSRRLPSFRGYDCSDGAGPDATFFATCDPPVAYQRTPACPLDNDRRTPPTRSRQLEMHTKRPTNIAASSARRSH